MPDKVGRNDPCPCGSGKKYKRCCRGKEPAGSFPPDLNLGPGEPELGEAIRRFEDSLEASQELPELLGWQEFDFEVDPFDPVLDDLSELLHRSDGRPDEKSLIIHEALGLRRHATGEVRARVLEELERRADKKTEFADPRVHACQIGLEDIEIDPIQIGLLLPFYHRYILGRLLERGDVLNKEEPTLDPSLKELAEKAGESQEDEEIGKLARRLGEMGPGALPYIEYFGGAEDLDEGSASIVEIAGRLPSMRSARILAIMLANSASGELNDRIYEAMARMPEVSWPLLLYQVGHPECPFWERLGKYPLLVRAEVGDVLEPLVDELIQGKRWKDPTPKDDLGEIADFLVRLRDRRGVGHLVRLIHEKKLPKASREAVHEAFGKNGWWGEIEVALEALRRGVDMLIPRGAKPSDLVKKKLISSPVESLEGANFQAGVATEDWNRAYHEDLDWLRPIDLEGRGPRETKLMGEFTRAVGEHLKRKEKVGSSFDLQNEFRRFEARWMTTPQPGLADRAPLGVILEEKRELTTNRAYFEKYLKKKLSEMVGQAREMLEEGHPDMGRTQLKTILEIDPKHAFAKRLLARME